MPQKVLKYSDSWTRCANHNIFNRYFFVDNPTKNKLDVSRYLLSCFGSISIYLLESSHDKNDHFLMSFFITPCLVFADNRPEHGDVFCYKIFQEHPSFTEKEYFTYFDSSFTSIVSFNQFQEYMANLHSNVGGNCVRYIATAQRAAGTYYDLTLSTDKDLDISFSLAVDKASKRFTRLGWQGVSNPTSQFNSWNDVGLALEAMATTNARIWADSYPHFFIK